MKRLIIALLMAILIAGCSAPAEKNYIKLNGFTQGTTYSITYYDSLDRNFAQPIEIILEQIDSSMSVYRKNSIINRFNESTKGIEVDSLLAKVVAISLQINQQTNGAFDMTVGPLVREWGFHAKQGEVPTKQTIEHYNKLVGIDMIELTGLSLSKKEPEVAIDVNAIAQGFTVDVIAEYLEDKHVTNYLVEVGGEIRASGISPRGKHWLVGIDKPEENALSGENLQVIISLSGKSLVTSGNYRKFFVRDGVKYSHTIDPTTGYPVTHSLLSATVIDLTAARADALATAFMVMGTEKTKQWLEHNPEVEAYLIFANQAGEFQVWMSAAMQKRIVE